jgi:hypothetical protein
MMRHPWILSLLLLTSCGVYTKLNDAVDRVDLATKEAEKALTGVEAGLRNMGEQGQKLADKAAEVRAAVAEADKNGDGKVAGLEEWYGLVMQLLAIFGIGGYAVSTNAKRRANTAAIYEQLDGLKDRIRETPRA